ncbi:F0F1 ATP synthase subunit delta [Bacteroidales bacterium OttesenSCG-928-K03]|nr:F0F1 ATP synthase subunit delta [Odoribacter sp. OttesenSCG-928-L07]MDL2239034.1 F0F1 ATP synthase subunit delta [Bacteroidales bacterium OttesenSCG-928-L14]MDL2240306.1 F0F1 ATP synthase subunit delta [Bacteroidales bacterium OttesenSCG-928-K22]MDL2242870.1 F0F1 ATP synthase subunit delta [Bacteroidales bacterium OttesenSCG-928-K03]
MDISLIPARYAKALLDYSTEVGMVKDVYRNMKNLAKNFTDFPKIVKALENPIVSQEDKKKLIVTAAGENVCDAFLRFVDLIIKNKREASIHFMALEFRDAYRKRHNIFYGKLTTVVPWNEESIDKLKKFLLRGREGTVEFHYVIDKDIIGGFIIEYDSKLLDASIAGQIKLINKELVERNRRIV